MKKIYPTKLTPGDEIRIIAPSRSLSIISEETKQIAKERFDDLGFTISFGKNVNETDDFRSSSIESRLEDLHDAFNDKNVKAILTVIGGFNSNQLLSQINWDLIKDNPKILCGYSDITALNNAIFAKTGLVTYSGPHFSSFGQKLHFDYTLEYFQKCLTTDEAFSLQASDEWSDDPWYLDQEKRSPIENQGYEIINEGEAKGTLLGSNICTFNLLQGTKFMPDISNSILFLEDDEESSPHAFDRDLQSIIHQSDFATVRGIIIGRFQKSSKITNSLLRQIISSKKELKNIPIVSNVDFGHTDPKITLPIGGEVEIKLQNTSTTILITKH